MTSKNMSRESSSFLRPFKLLMRASEIRNSVNACLLLVINTLVLFV